jgi:hypothetical protein
MPGPMGPGRGWRATGVDWRLLLMRKNPKTMILSTSAIDAPIREVAVTGQTYRLQEFIGQAPVRGTYVDGSEADDNALPQGFLVFQPPNSITQPHFHETNQFQVFVGGSAKFGKKPAAPLTVQYASGHTPYGPIAAGEEGVVYYTLRQRWDPGAKYMPKMREKLVRGRQRQRLLVADEAIDGLSYLLEPEEDGLMAARLKLRPHETALLEEHGVVGSSDVDANGRGAGSDVQHDNGADGWPPGGGQYHVVLEGGVAYNDQLLPQRSCQYAAPDAEPISLTAGRHGAVVLILRFPR